MLLNFILFLLLTTFCAVFSQQLAEPDYEEDYAVQQQENAPPKVYLDHLQKMKLVDDGKRRRGGPKPQQNLLLPPQLQRIPNNLDIDAELRNLNATFKCVTSWPDSSVVHGSVSGVSIDSLGNVVMFHRSDRVWNLDTFNTTTNVFKTRNLGPIKDNTIIALDPKTGQQVYAFGKNLFYMPHGISLDQDDNVWVTDVGLHQIMKLTKMNDTPELVLGSKFVPGNTRKTFCKPTSVAVLPNGDFFVADGYCNARIIKYNKQGEFILQWGKNSFQGRAYPIAPENSFAIPHKLTLALDKGLVCVADRENGRVQCFQHSDGTFHSQYHSPLIGDRLFSVAYSPLDGGRLYVVNGPYVIPTNEIKGFVIDMTSGNVSSKFPVDINFTNPHDVAVSADGQEVYVAEFDPYRIHKMISLNYQPIALTKPSSTVVPNLPPLVTTSAAKVLLIIAVVAVFGLLGLGVAFVARQRRRGMMGGNENEDDVEYSRLMSKSGQNE